MDTCKVLPDYNTARGFTLVEIMMVMVILSVLAFFVAPEVMNWRPNMRLTDMAQKLYADLQNAKVTAIERNKNVILTARPDGQLGYWIFIDHIDINQAWHDDNGNNLYDQGDDEEVIADVSFVEQNGTTLITVDSNTLPDPLIFTTRGTLAAGSAGIIVLRRDDDDEDTNGDGLIDQQFKWYRIRTENNGGIHLETKLNSTSSWE